MSEAQDSGGLSRRRFLQASAAGAAVAALPAGASAQDSDGDDEDDTDGTTYEPPDQFIGNESNAIGADRMLIGALKYDESDRTPDGWTDATIRVLMKGMHPDDYYDDPTDLDDAASNGILQLGKMDSADHHVLTNMFNEIQLARNQAWFEGLAAFLEKVENDAGQSETVTAAENAGVDHFATVQSNLATFWKEQINQLKAYQAYLQESFDGDAGIDVAYGNVLEYTNNSGGDDAMITRPGSWWEFPEKDVELLNGDTLTVPGWSLHVCHERYPDNQRDVYTNYLDSTEDANWLNGDYQVNGAALQIQLPDGSATNAGFGFDPNQPTTKQEIQDIASQASDETVADVMKERLDRGTRRVNMYRVLWDWLEQEAQLVKDNLNEVANNTYGQLQTGELTIEEFVQANPAFAASEYATDYESTGHYTYAAATMASVGAAYNFEKEMKVELDDGTTLSGTMLVSNDDFSVSVGETVDPSKFEGQVYFAYSGETAERELSTEEYQAAVDGGVITLTSTPVEDTRYTVLTIEGEFVHLTDEDWQPVDEQAAVDPESTTDWTYDATDYLDDPITEIESITNHYPDETGAGMVRIENPFKILEAYNTETGDEVDEVNGEEGTDLSDTETQFTEEDLEAFRNMVDAVNEESDPPGADPGGGLDLDLGDDVLPDWINPRNVIIAIAAIVGVNVATN